MTTDCHSEESAKQAEEKAISIFEKNMSDNIDEIDFDITVSLSLNQYGFPIEGVSIKSSPLIADLNNNSINRIKTK